MAFRVVEKHGSYAKSFTSFRAALTHAAQRARRGDGDYDVVDTSVSFLAPPLAQCGPAVSRNRLRPRRRAGVYYAHCGIRPMGQMILRRERRR